MTNDDGQPVADDASALSRLAARLARGAGTLAGQGRDQQWASLREPEASVGSREANVPATPTTKSSLTDLVTEHDRAAERFLVDALSRARPDDGIVGEEGSDVAGASGYRWYVDPIDGTTNFVYGHPMWATSVAVGDGDGMLAGAVYAPDTDELFAAARGHGATLNGVPIAASATSELHLALVATGFSYTATRRVDQVNQLASIIGQVRDIRRGGSAALDLCYVAAGRLDGYFERPLNVWDLAAGELIAREAGCRSCAFDGGPPTATEALVAAPEVFEALQELVQHVTSPTTGEARPW